MPEAVAVIQREHRSLTAVISALEHLAREVAAGAEPDYDLLTVILDYIEAFPNRLHHPKEDRYLFSAVRARCDAAARILDELEEEHRRGDQLTRELRYLLTRCRLGGAEARQAFAAAVQRYAEFHWAHMRKEEDHVLPLALEALTPDDWTAIDAAFAVDDEPPAEMAPRQELEALFRLIVRLAPPPVGVGPAGAERRGTTRVGIPLWMVLPVALAVMGCTGSQSAARAAPPAGPAAVASPAAPVPVPPGSAAPLPVTPAPSTIRTATPDLLASGRRLYDVQCAPCHGVGGRGDGEAAYLLYPKPRDFTTATYRLVSTWERRPTDTDLYETISRGMPGSAMPSWGHLAEEERWGLVHYVKSLAAKPWTIPPPADPRSEGQMGQGVIRVPPAPPFTAEARALALERYADACASCHGKTGKGDGAEDQKDDLGYPTRPRDLTVGVFKGSPDPEHLYRRIVAGSPGTPMPMSDWAYGAEAWHLVNLIRSWSSDSQRERAEMRRFRIVARRVERLPEHPDAGAWQLAPPVNLHLMPLWWRSDRPEEITVRALHDARQIALLLTWSDATHDHTAMRPQDFRDAVAVQFSLTPAPPFFAMGDRGRSVNIWMWKSERQADLEPAFQDLEKVYPNLGIDSYPNARISPVEQPTRHALTLDSDPLLVTGWGAGNIVSDPLRKSPAEDLAAQGFGTLRARPRDDQAVDARGVYATGTYRVMLRRDLVGRGPQAVTLGPGMTVPVGFAVWNGGAGDRDGKKSVTIWQDLVLEP